MHGRAVALSIGSTVLALRLSRYRGRWAAWSASTLAAPPRLSAASLHFLAASPDALVLEYCTEPLELSSGLAKDPFRQDGGCMRVPDALGLGAEPDMAVIERHLAR
jgi:L-alanine-DL-glutamate epimerase-like enolase superfamily enzyme